MPALHVPRAFRLGETRPVFATSTDLFARHANPATLVSATFAPAGYDLGFASDPFFSGGGFRVVTDAGENFSAPLGGVFTSGSSAFVGAGDVNTGASLAFGGLAIDVDFGTGYAFDADLDTLFVTYDANFAEFFTVGGLGGDFTAMASFDFVDAGTLLAALSTDSFTSGLYTVDPTTGLATLTGSFGAGIQAIAVDPGAIPEPSSFAALAGLAVLGIAASRRLSAPRHAYPFTGYISDQHPTFPIRKTTTMRKTLLTLAASGFSAASAFAGFVTSEPSYLVAPVSGDYDFPPIVTVGDYVQRTGGTPSPPAPPASGRPPA